MRDKFMSDIITLPSSMHLKFEKYVGYFSCSSPGTLKAACQKIR